MDKAPGADDVPPLSEHYHRARKQYGLFSGLLLVWAVVGINIGETPVENLKITLLNPESVPVILFLLILYFAFRVTIEWLQCNSNRRLVLASLVDFYSAHALGAVSALVYSIQQASRFRIADFFNNLPVAALIPVTVLSTIFVLITTRKMLLGLGSFAPQKTYGTHFTLPSATMLHKVAHIAILMGLILMPIFAVYSAFFIKSFINVAMQIGIFLGYFCAVIWVYYFEFWYRQRKIAPAAPTGFTVS